MNKNSGLFGKKLDLSSDVYDRETALAVAKFQSQHALSRDLKVHKTAGLTADGIAGISTIVALLAKNGSTFSAQQVATLLPRLERGGGNKWVEPKHTEKEHSSSRKSMQSDRLISQVSSWDCGPTAAAMALSPLSGSDPQRLAEQFRAMQGGGSMSWENPSIFAQTVGCQCAQFDSVSPEQLSRHIKNGGTVMVSVKPGPLTTGGHIIALGRVTRDREGGPVFENLDPHQGNLRKGYTHLDGPFLNVNAKQYWLISPKQEQVIAHSSGHSRQSSEG